MADKWIQSAIKHKGALTAYAKRHGKLTPDGTINKEWLSKLAQGSGAWAKRAQLALTLGKLGEHK